VKCKRCKLLEKQIRDLLEQRARESEWIGSEELDRLNAGAMRAEIKRLKAQIQDKEKRK